MPTTSEMHPGHAGETCVTVLAWWQLEQSAWCPFCLQGYAWELHVACIECDRASCPLCVDREREAGPHCPECAGGAADHEPAAEASP
jgi:hypothetical protein